MSRKKIVFLFVAAFIFTICVFNSIYVLSVDEQAVVLRLGKVVASLQEPGLYFKAPFVDSLTKYTKRLMEYDAAPVAVVTSDKKNLVFDTIAIYRIVDPDTFYRRVRTLSGVQQRLDDSIYSSVRVIAGRMTFDDLVKDKRLDALNQAAEMANQQSKEYGVIIDMIAYKRVFLPTDNEQAVYRSMQAERNRVAGQLRAEGQARAVSMKSEADRKETEILSESRKKAEQIKGEGDKKAQDIISSAIEESQELYIFIKTLDFYKDALKNKKMILEPSGEILRYLKDSN